MPYLPPFRLNPIIRRTLCSFALAASAGSALLQAQVSVTPDGTTVPGKSLHTSGYTHVFKVTNIGTGSQTFDFSCAGNGGITCTNLSSTSATIPENTFVNVTATYNTSNEGTGRLTFTASGGTGTDQGYINVPVVTAAGVPHLSALPYLEAKQDLARCAVSCFAATYAQSTVPYIALDAPRNVTLVYHGDRVSPKPIVAVDVFPDTTYGTWPSEYQFQVKISGSLVTFINGEQTLRFAGTSGSSRYRLAGQFDASAYSHGRVYPLEILVTTVIGGSSFTNRWVTQYLHVDEATDSSAVARGWTIAGVQRLHGQSDGSKLIVEGDGSATYFKYDSSTGVLAAPSGDFSTLNPVGSTWVRAYPDSTKLTFASTGVLAKITDRWGNRDTLLYDSKARLTQLKDPLNNTIVLAYGSNGLSSITDPMSRATNITVQSNKTLTAIQDPDGVSTTLGYDGSLRLQTITNRRGKTTTLAYDGSSGKVSTITGPSIPVYGGGSSSPVTTLSAWQSKGVPYSATNVTAFTPPKADTVYARVTEPGSAVTKFTVNRWGTPSVTTDALSRTTTVTYSANGQPVKIVAPGYGSGVADTLAYNNSGLVVFSKAAGGTGTTILYGGWAQPTDVYGPGQDSTHYTLGTNGRISSIKVGGTTVQSLTYDSYGRVATVTDGNGNVTKIGYYSSGTHRNRQVDTLPGTRITSYSYDSYGRRTTITPPGAAPQTTYYSVINRVDSVKVATSTPTVTKYVYDSLHLKKVTDPKGQDYQFIYNDLGWLIKQLDPAGNRDTLQYNVDGDLRRRTNRRGQNIDFGYDAIHRITSQTGSNSVTWGYPSDTSMVAVSSAATDTTWTLLRPDSTKVTVKTILNSQAFVMTSLYAGAGRLDSVRVSGGGLSFTSRDYVYAVPKGILTDIKLNGSTTTLTPDANFKPTAISFPGGATLTLQQGSLAPVKETAETNNNSYLERWIGINELGQIDRHLRNTAKLGRWFDYDSLGQLRKGRTMFRTPESIPGGCPTTDFGMSASCTPTADYSEVSSNTYTYDAAGNRTDNSGTYNTGNRITAFNSCTYTTDADGNVTSRKGSSPCVQIDTLLWTAEGHLDSLKVGTTGIKYFYDASGRLVQKRVNGSSSSYFLWDGDNLLAELNGSASAIRAEYSYWSGLDNPHALIVGGTRYYARLDGLGNVLALTDTTKAVKSTYQYDDWGQLTAGGDSASFSGVDRMRWKGTLWMGPEVELYYMRNRWYEPASGRFLTEDPKGLAGGINPLPYAGNDPVNRADPLGLQTRLDPIVVTGANPWGGLWSQSIAPWYLDAWYAQQFGVASGHPVGDLVVPFAGGGGSRPPANRIPRPAQSDATRMLHQPQPPDACFATNIQRGLDFFGLPLTVWEGSSAAFAGGGAVAQGLAGRMATASIIDRLLASSTPGASFPAMTEAESQAIAQGLEAARLASSGRSLARFGSRGLVIGGGFAVGLHDRNGGRVRHRVSSIMRIARIRPNVRELMLFGCSWLRKRGSCTHLCPRNNPWGIHSRRGCLAIHDDL